MSFVGNLTFLCVLLFSYLLNFNIIFTIRKCHSGSRKNAKRKPLKMAFNFTDRNAIDVDRRNRMENNGEKVVCARRSHRNSFSTIYYLFECRDIATENYQNQNYFAKIEQNMRHIPQWRWHFCWPRKGNVLSVRAKGEIDFRILNSVRAKALLRNRQILGLVNGFRRSHYAVVLAWWLS